MYGTNLPDTRISVHVTRVLGTSGARWATHTGRRPHTRAGDGRRAACLQVLVKARQGDCALPQPHAGVYDVPDKTVTHPYTVRRVQRRDEVMLMGSPRPDRPSTG